MTPATANLSDGSRRVILLVAEDDPASGQFFSHALARCGYAAHLVADGNDALAAARAQGFDVLLLDCHLPGAGAMAILAALRAEPEAACHRTPAIATSAEMHAAQRQRLLQSGFADAIAKPVTVAQLKAALRPLLASGTGGEPLLDDIEAMVTSGTPAAVGALRRLFAEELTHLADELETLAARPDALAERLHRLLASCGLCGAHALGDASQRLKLALACGSVPPIELARFRQTLAATLRALTAAPDIPRT